MPLSTSYLQLALAHARNSRVKNYQPTLTALLGNTPRSRRKKSILLHNGSPWVKKDNDGMLDATMRSFDGAELCELVGLFILNDLANKYGTNNIGLYRTRHFQEHNRTSSRKNTERNKKALQRTRTDNNNPKQLTYSCMPNIGSIINNHNKKLLTTTTPQNGWNCRKKDQCPLDNNCLTTSVIYKTNVTTDKDDTGKNYIGLTEGTF